MVDSKRTRDHALRDEQEGWIAVRLAESSKTHDTASSGEQAEEAPSPEVDAETLHGSRWGDDLLVVPVARWRDVHFQARIRIQGW